MRPAAGLLLLGMVPSLAVAAAPERRAGSRWEIRLGADLRHDSNVLELSAHDRKLVGDPAHADRFRLKSVDDWLVRPELGLSWSRNLLEQRTTRLTLGVAATRHLTNSYLDRERWSLGFDQELGRDRRPTMSRVGILLDTTPRMTLRRLKDDEESLRQGRTVRVDARYRSRGARIEGAVELVRKRLALELGVDREWRDYVRALDERDDRLDGWDARLVGVAGKRWRLRAGWRGERLDAKGDDPGTPLTEDDISSDRDIVSADARISWGKAHPQRVSFGLDRERRRFTAKSPFDFYHHARRDERLGWRAGWHVSLPHGLSLDAEAAGDGNRSTFSQPPPGITAEDATDYDVTTFTVSLGWRLGLGRER